MTDRNSTFVPRFCPRSDCAFHRSPEGWRWVRHGHFTRRASPQRIPRFRCVHCRHTFSSQSFSCDYWLKRPDVLRAAAFRLLTCSGFRQIAREARCAPTTVMRVAARLARQALLHLEAKRPSGPVAEPLVVDGFESFAHSQYHPLHLNLVVGAETHYIYAFTHTELRRKGRMTEQQKRRRAVLEARHGRADPRGIERGVEQALRLAARTPQPLVVRSDEHADYPRALRRLHGYAIRHECTSSLQARTAGNPLFPVNRVDLLMRHNSANHKRETIAFSKRHQGVVDRALWLVLWQNFAKPFSERRGGPTPAMRLGLDPRAVPLLELLRTRWFASRIPLPELLQRYHRGEVPTRRYNRERRFTSCLAP
jgi:transposase-like protein